MAGQCKECRFYDGKICAVTKSVRTVTSSCSYWVSNTATSTVKQCKACRFFDGKNCSSGGGARTPTSSCGKWTGYR